MSNVTSAAVWSSVPVPSPVPVIVMVSPDLVVAFMPPPATVIARPDVVPASSAVMVFISLLVLASASSTKSVPPRL